MSVNITQTPKIVYNELTTNPLGLGEGTDIPIFIGRTNNENISDSDLEIKKYLNYSQCCREVDDGGIGTDINNNPLLKVLDEFFTEVGLANTSDASVPYIYVIDLGEADTSDYTLWDKAMTLAKTLRDVQVESYIGFNEYDDNLQDIVNIINHATNSIKEDLRLGNPRIGYFSVDATDNVLIKLTNNVNNERTVTIRVKDQNNEIIPNLSVYDSASNSNAILDSRMVLLHPVKAGAILASFLISIYYNEPGYRALNSVTKTDIPSLTPEEELALQNAGIAFLRTETAGAYDYVKICLGVSTGFANSPRPNDCLVHSRRNVDHLIRRLYEALYKQLKRNETEINIAYCQTDVDVIVEEEKSIGALKDETSLVVRMDEENKFHLIVEGAVYPVNASDLIDLNIWVGV